MKKTNVKLCPKCKSSLQEKTYLYRDHYTYIEKEDVTKIGNTQEQLWSYGGASGVIYKNKGMDIKEFFKHSTGIGVIENKLECRKCGYSIQSLKDRK